MIAALLALVLAAPYTPVAVKNGMTISRRKLDNGLLEVKVEAHTALTVKAVFSVLWNHAEYPKFIKTSKVTKVLADKGKERIVYEQVRIPVVQDRDYTIRGWYQDDPATGLVQLYWEGADALGPPENRDHVRIRRTQGSWTLEPTKDGGTDVTYICASEPGGNVPTWLVAGAQTDAAPEYVSIILSRAKSLTQNP